MFLTGHALSIYALSIHPEGDAMASSSSVLQDDSWLSRADRALLPVERALEFLTVMLILVVILALIWGSWAHFDRSFDFSKPLWSRDSSIDIGIPMWPAKLLVPVAFSLLAVRLVLQMIGYGRALVLGLERPVAVPLILTIEEQAMAEAAHLAEQE